MRELKNVWDIESEKYELTEIFLRRKWVFEMKKKYTGKVWMVNIIWLLNQEKV